jgi:ubiquinone/menaquinone biosynthesis C-methylase UbiE
MCPDEDPYAKWSDEYDDLSQKSQWHGPAILFGMMFPHLRPGQSLLDVGIGTGLGALSFHRSGLKIVGIDNSPAMIRECKSRGLPWEIIEHDLTKLPWPLKDNSVDHVVSAGVSHFVANWSVAILETSRLLKAGGLFGFDFDEFDPEKDERFAPVADGVYETYNAEYDEFLYRYSETFVFGALAKAGFEIVHDTEFLVSKENRNYFRAIVARLGGRRSGHAPESN